MYLNNCARDGRSSSYCLGAEEEELGVTRCASFCSSIRVLTEASFDEISLTSSAHRLTYHVVGERRIALGRAVGRESANVSFCTSRVELLNTLIARLVLYALDGGV